MKFNKKKRNKAIKKLIRMSLLIIVFIIAARTFYVKTHQREINRAISQTLQAQRDKLAKSDYELLGKRITISRDNKAWVKANLYIPENSENKKLPVIFNIHGGDFKSGDADMLDTYSNRICNEWNSIIVTINYTKEDIMPKEYAIEEVADTILYFADHAEEYNADVNKFVVLGYSAGAYHGANAVIKLNKINFNIAKQILCYPILEDIAENNKISTTILVCGKDSNKEDAINYRNRLQAIGASVELQEYKDAYSGFIEENNPEYNRSEFKNDNARKKGQDEMAKQAENYIKELVSSLK